jgi:hypothetical protein
MSLACQLATHERVLGFAEPLPTTNPDSPSSEACAPLLDEISQPIMRPRVARHHARARARSHYQTENTRRIPTTQTKRAESFLGLLRLPIRAVCARLLLLHVRACKRISKKV